MYMFNPYSVKETVSDCFEGVKLDIHSKTGSGNKITCTLHNINSKFNPFTTG